jgi:hypothetical protein
MLDGGEKSRVSDVSEIVANMKGPQLRLCCNK